MNKEKELSNIPENHVELNENILNSINLLVEAAKKTSKEEEISKLEEEIQVLETAKEQYSQEIKKEFELDKKNLNDKVQVVKKVVNQKIGRYRTKIESMNQRLEEYEQDVKEQQAKMEEEKRQLEELETLPKTRENMLKKVELEWAITAYQEYLEFMYEEIDDLKSSIIETKEKIRELKQTAHEELDEDVRRFNSKYNIEYGNTKPTYTNNELIVKLNDALKAKQEELEFYKKDPEKLGNEIIDTMKSGEDKEVISEKLENLTSLIGGKVSGIINLDEAKNLEEQFNILQEEKATVENRLNENNYIMQDALTNDQELIQKYTEDLESYKQELAKLQEQLEVHNKQRNLPKMKRKLKDITKVIKDTKKQQERIEKYSKPKSREFARMVISLEKEKAKLETEIKELEEKPKITFTGEIKREIEDYKKRIETRERKKIELTQKTKEDYIDLKRKAEDEELLQAINEDIEILIQKENALTEHDPFEVTDGILKDYEKLLNKNEKEEILTFYDAKDILVEKIKSSEFAQKASAAISGIKTLFTKSKNPESNFDYGQIVDNVTANMVPGYYIDQDNSMSESYEAENAGPAVRK